MKFKFVLDLMLFGSAVSAYADTPWYCDQTDYANAAACADSNPWYCSQTKYANAIACERER